MTTTPCSDDTHILNAREHPGTFDVLRVQENALARVERVRCKACGYLGTRVYSAGSSIFDASHEQGR